MGSKATLREHRTGRGRKDSFTRERVGKERSVSGKVKTDSRARVNVRADLRGLI